MTPTDPVLAYLRKRVKLDDEHVTLVTSVVVDRRVAKGAFVQRASDPEEPCSRKPTYRVTIARLVAERPACVRRTR